MQQWARPRRRPWGRRRGVLLASLLPVLGACGETVPPHVGEPTGPPIPQGTTGVLGVVDGGLAFRSCGEEGAMPVSDDTGEDLMALVAELGFGGDEVAVHLVLDGPRVVEVRMAAPEGLPCRDLLSQADLRAQGNEPFWLVDVEGRRAVFRSPEELEGVPYDEGAWEATEGGWRFEALRHHVDGMAYLTLELEAGRCLDSMSGAWFPFRASLRRDGERYTGCAAEGQG